MKKIIRKIAKKGRHSELFWRYGFNFFPWINYKLKPSDTNGHSVGSVVNELNLNGIAITNINKLFGEQTTFSELESAVNQLLETRSEELNRMRQSANDPKIGDKTFNVELLGSSLNFEADDIFARFALQQTFLNIANDYFRMLVKLRYYNVWLTFATNSKARESQLWHFDREDNYILKIFLYLDDVDKGTGPFTYAPKTHRKGNMRNVKPEHFFEGGIQRSTDEQMAAVIPDKDWIQAIGKKGTIVFADTRGYHKGGEAREKDRLMYTFMFTSAASESKRLLKFKNQTQVDNLTDRQIAALEIN